MLTVPGPHGDREVRLSSPDKTVWPATDSGDAITKADLAAYLMAVGEPLLRALGDRPVTLQRVRDGITGEVFYSKNPPKGVPEWVRTTMVTYPSGRSHPQLVVDEVAAAAGVSRATVSRVMNGRASVARDIAERVPSSTPISMTFSIPSAVA